MDDVGQSGFKLTFSIDKQSPLQILFLLTGGLPLLFMRVVIVARQRLSQCADRRRHHQQQHFARRQRLQLHAHAHGQRPDRADGPVATGAAFHFPPCPRRRALRCCCSSTHSSA